MKSAAPAALCLALAFRGACASSVSPIGKVVQLLSDLKAKIVSEGEEAHKVYSEFAEFCEDRSKQLGFDIKTSKAQATDLEAAISQETALIGSLNAKMEKISGSIASDQADLKAAKAVRAKESADFLAEEKELTEVIDMLSRAIGILEREMQKGGASMIQLKDAASVTQALSLLVQASALSTKDGAKLTALVQAAQGSEDSSSDSSLGAPAAAVYEGHGGDIVSTLEGLLEKAESQLAEARKKETAAKHNFEMTVQSLEDSIKFSSKDMAKAKTGLAQSGESKATAQGDLDVTTKDLKVDTESLADLHKDCLTKAQDYEAATKSRDEEIKAITEAKKAIQETTGGAEKVVYGLSQVSFVQLGRSGAGSVGLEVVHLLRDLARRQGSAALTQLASRVASATHAGTLSGEDPFGKVKGLIADMISKLEDEAGADASHKEYCDKSLAEANGKKADKDMEIEKLTTKIDQMAARSAQLKEEVASLQKSLSELASAQAEMDKARFEEHDDYVKNKADLEQGLTGTKLALKVLHDYYGGASGDHTPAEGAGSGIIGLLEVIESDISKSLAEMTAAEETAAVTYKSETKENEIETASKSQDVKYKTKEAASLDKAAAEANSDRSTVQQELEAVLDTLKALNKECVAKAGTYEERKARREAELEGLKRALEILDGQAALIQRQQSRRTLRGRRSRQAVL